MNQLETSHYTFGDNDLAALRLQRLAAAYAPSSTAFLHRAVPRTVARALDLGSGLGLTTELLREITQASYVVGYERSPRYLELARARFPKVRFREADVVLPHYPDRSLDVIYSRFLLTHMHEPQRVMATCVEHLRPRGRLLLEETSVLSSPIVALQRYYAMVGEMQAHYGQELYIGLRLESLGQNLADCSVTARQTEILLDARTMAQLHAMNISTWKHDPFMLSTHGILVLEQLEADLNAIASSERVQPSVSSVMAQVVIQRD